MKKLSLSICVVVALASVASLGFAQRPGGPPGRPGMGGGMMGRRGKPGERQKKMLDGLGLSAAQKKKAYALVDHQMKEMQGLGFKRGQRPSPDMMKKFRGIRDEFDKKLEKILTPKQLKKYKDEQAAARARFRGMGGPGGRPMMGGPGGRPGGH